MNFLFITRCTVPDNLITIKRNLQKIFFSGQDTYKHHIICDVAGGTDSESLQSYIDNVTDVTYVFTKRAEDKYCS